MKRLIILVVASLFLGGCATHLYNTDNHNISETQVVLSENNFKVVGIANGSATKTTVFGIGGLSAKSLKGNALADMYKNANLTGSQAIINITFKTSVAGYAPIYTRTEYTASGVIIEFIDE